MAGLTLEQARFYEEQALQLGVPAGWIADFLAKNPGDQHRILDAYAGEAGGMTPTAALIQQAGGLEALEALAPARPPDPPPAPIGSGPSGFSLLGGSGSFSLTSLLILALMAGAGWYLWKAARR